MASQFIELVTAADRYTLSASDLQDGHVQMNGTEMKLGIDDAIPQFSGVSTASGKQTLAPATITFFAIPNANNAGCRQVTRTGAH